MTEKRNAHSRKISCVAFSPDKKTIVSACDGGTIKVWVRSLFSTASLECELTSASLPVDAASLTLKSEKTNAHSGEVRSVAFSPDGKTIVSGSNDKMIKVWNSGKR